MCTQAWNASQEDCSTFNSLRILSTSNDATRNDSFRCLLHMEEQLNESRGNQITHTHTYEFVNATRNRIEIEEIVADVTNDKTNTPNTI